MSDSPLATIDISGFTTSGDDSSLRIAREVANSCTRTGFLIIKGHGIAMETIEKVHLAGRTFFDLPLEEKEYYKKIPGTHSGYSTYGSTKLAYTLGNSDAGADLREGFSSGRPDITDDDPFFTRQALRAFYSPFIWPREISEYRGVWIDYFQQVTRLAEKIMQIFAVALGLPVDYFDAMMEKHVSNLTVFNYPEQLAAPGEQQLRGGAHTDFGSLTLVHADWSITGGLQIFNDNLWHDVHAQAGTFVVNIGDMMQRWTNDKWVSTLHRVANPLVETAAGNRRQSLVYFHTPNPEVLVECIPTCLASGQTPRYTPISIGDHHLMKMGKLKVQQGMNSHK